ncbi:FecR domain-containing protein [Balamuthia mandrillaris]
MEESSAAASFERLVETCLGQGPSALVAYLHGRFPAALWSDQRKRLRANLSSAPPQISLDKKDKEEEEEDAANGEGGEGGGGGAWSNADLTHHFFTKYGVNVGIEGVFYLFKYEVTVALEWPKEIRECRGIILQRSDLKAQPDSSSASASSSSALWEVAARPFDKFFNQEESQCPFSTKQVFEQYLSEFELVEKADGSCIQLWHCPEEVMALNWKQRQMEEAAKKNKKQQANGETEAEEEAEAEEEEKDEAEEEAAKRTKELLEKAEAKKQALTTKSEALLTTEERRELIYGKKSKRKQNTKTGLNDLNVDEAMKEEAVETEADKEKEEPTTTIRRAAHLSGWRSSTLGKITPHPRFEQLFWKLLNVSSAVTSYTNEGEEETNAAKAEGEEKAKVEAVLAALHPDYTYLFELCCDENRVVNKYPQDTVFLIGARHRVNGTVLSKQKLDEVASRLGVMRPQYILPSEEGIETLSALRRWIESEAKRTDLYGEVPEGFVVYWQNVPVAKMKNKSYLDKHGLITGNLLYNRNIVIQRYFEGTLDDVQGVLQPSILLFIDELKAKVLQKIKVVEEMCRDLFETKLPPDLKQHPKARALYPQAVKKHISLKYDSFFFQHKERLVFGIEEEEEVPFGGLVMEWLKKNYAKFNTEWKQTNIPEILEAERQQSGL